MRQNEMTGERPASFEWFDEAADQISGRNLPVFKTGFVECVMRKPANNSWSSDKRPVNFSF